MPRKDTTAGAVSAQAQQDAASEGIDNFEFPKSLVTKIARGAVAENVKLQKEMVLAVLKASAVFVNYLAATAHDVASSKQHKSISASDILKALELLEFGDMVGTLQTDLQVYREHHKADKKKGGNKGNAKEAESAASATSKAKGKEKASLAKIVIPGSRPPAGAAQRQATPEPEPGADENEGEGQAMIGEDEEMLDAEQEEDEPEADEADDDEDDDDEEEHVDQIALEEEELRRDANNVGGSGVGDRDVDD